MDKDAKQAATGLVLSNSTRLQAMRNKAQAAPQAANSPQTVSKAPEKNAELQWLQGLINQRIGEIMASMPVGKSRRFFKIRYGFDPDEIGDLPIRRLLYALAINHPVVSHPTVSLKRVMELTYNGVHPDSG